MTAYDYICHECAMKQGATWPEGHCATFHEGKCCVCKEKKALCCVSDYDWPDGRYVDEREI